MLRQKLRRILVEEKLRNKFAKVLNLVAIVGFMWIFAGPGIAREAFTSENALRVQQIETAFNRDGAGAHDIYTRIRTDIDSMP